MKNKDSKWSEVISYLKTLTPSGIELEFISLASFDLDKNAEEGSSLQSPNSILLAMLNILLQAIESNQDSDFVQAMLNNFLSNHYDIIVQDDELSTLLSNIKDIIKSKFTHVESLVASNLCMTQYFAGLNEFWSYFN